MKKVRIILKFICLLALVGYIWYTLDTTVFGRDEYSAYRYKALPFWSYVAIYDGNEILIKEDLLNVALFIPIGFLLGLVMTNKRWWKALLFGSGLSVSIEMMQLIGKRGTCEFDDVFHNTIGCLIGFFVVLGIMRIYNIIGKTSL